jgi:hypothetical protein
MSPIPTITVATPDLATAVAEFNARIETPVESVVNIESVVEADSNAFTSLVLKAQADRFAALKQRVSLWRERGAILDRITTATTSAVTVARTALADAEVTAREKLAMAGVTPASWKGSGNAINGPGSQRDKAFDSECVKRHPLVVDAAQRLREATKAATSINAATAEQSGLVVAEQALTAFVAATLASVVTPQVRA